MSQLITKAKLEYYQNKVAATRSKDPSNWFKSIYSISGATEDTSKLTTPTPKDLYTVVERLQDILTKPWKDHVPALSLINPEGLPNNSSSVPSIGQVTKLLIELNSKKATGSDNISAWTLKRFAEELAVVVHDIICASILERKYPTLYKHALVSPVPKVHPPENLETDFRRISV